MTAGAFLVLWLVLAAAPPASGGSDGGGLSGLGDMFGEPDRADTGQPTGQGAPAPAKREDAPRVAAPTAPATEAAALDARIGDLEKQVAEMKKVTWKNAPPVLGSQEAKETVEGLRRTYDQLRKGLDAADPEATRRAAGRVEAFEKQWNDRLPTQAPGLTLADLRKGVKPADVDPKLWAELCDRFYGEEADLKADLAQTAQQISAERLRQLADAKKALDKAEDWYRRWRERDDREGKATSVAEKEMGWRAHQAKLAAMQAALADLKRLREERQGRPPARQDPLTLEAYKGTGFWMADKIQNEVAREITLSDCTDPPKTRPHERDALKDGLPLPKWMGEYDAKDRQRTKCQWLAEQLRLAHQGLRNAERDVLREDEAALRRCREVLEDQDRQERGLDDPVLQAKREKALKERARELEATRAKRTDELKAFYSRNVTQYSTLLETDSALLDDMLKKER